MVVVMNKPQNIPPRPLSAADEPPPPPLSARVFCELVENTLFKQLQMLGRSTFPLSHSFPLGIELTANQFSIACVCEHFPQTYPV